MIIFNNNGQPQTDDLVFKLGGYYNKDGLQGEVITAIGHLLVKDSSVSSDAVYDLQGRRVEQPKAGIYIQNRKRIVIR